jgi:hypothetical protein
MKIQWSRYNVESESGGFRTYCYDCAYGERDYGDFHHWCEALTSIVERITEHEQSVHTGTE